MQNRVSLFYQCVFNVLKRLDAQKALDEAVFSLLRFGVGTFQRGFSLDDINSFHSQRQQKNHDALSRYVTSLQFCFLLRRDTLYTEHCRIQIRAETLRTPIKVRIQLF